MRAKLIKSENGDADVVFACPGCKKTHVIPVTCLSNPSKCWGFNFDLDRPTLTPSILTKGVRMITDEEVKMIIAGQRVEPEPMVCHSFVTLGCIQFLSDCTHSLRGQTVDLPEVLETT